MLLTSEMKRDYINALPEGRTITDAVVTFVENVATGKWPIRAPQVEIVRK